MKVVTTTSGAVYEFSDDLSTVQRVGKPMRKDGEPIRLLVTPGIEVGLPMRLLLEPLAADALMTQRITTTVVSVEQR